MGERMEERMEERMDEEQEKWRCLGTESTQDTLTTNPVVSPTEPHMTCAMYHTFQLMNIHSITKLWVSSCHMLLSTISNIFFSLQRIIVNVYYTHEQMNV